MTYAEFVSSLTSTDGIGKRMSYASDIVHGCIGIASESGELADAVKKYVAYGHAMDVDNLEEELGDLLFYIQMICNVFGWTLSDIMDANETKLRKRYPSGSFDKDDSHARRDKNV